MLTLGSGTLYAAPWYAGGQVQPPTGVTLGQAATGGLLSNGTYYVRVTAYNANGESGPTAEQSIVVNGGGATQKITVTFTAPATGPAPTGYRVYIGTVSGFSTAQGTTAASPYNQTTALTTTGMVASLVGLQTIGEVGGDVELDIQYSEKDFYGQSNFPIARAFYGGKATLKAKKVELMLGNLEAYFAATQWANSGVLGSGSDVYSVFNNSVPQPLYLVFTHTRSDVTGKTVVVEGMKATSKQILHNFVREDISLVDWEFEFMVDQSANANKANATNLLMVVTSTQ